jgi:hypothetical protein
LAVGFADDADPWRRGQAATPPGRGELTTGETVRFSLSYSEPLVAGKPFPVGVEWEYQRQTTGHTRRHRVREDRVNTHLVSKAAFDAVPAVSHGNEMVDLTATFERPDSKLYAGPDLYTYALVVAPSGRFARVRLEDTAHTGTYRCRFVPAQLAARWGQQRDEVRGTWKVFVCAQDTNAAVAGEPPEQMAQFLGGYMVHAPFPISVDGSRPCPDKPDTTFTLV